MTTRSSTTALFYGARLVGWPILAVALLSSTHAFAQSAGGDAKRFALIMPVLGPPPLDGRVDEKIRAVAKALPGVVLVTRERTDALLEDAAGLGLDCDYQDEGCLTKLAIVVDVDLLVAPVVSEANGREVSLLCVDTNSTPRARHLTEKLQEVSEQALRRHVVAVMTPQAFLGRLQVNVDVDGAEIGVDGISVARTPLIAPLDVQVGERNVSVYARGYAPTSQKVSVRFDEQSTIDISLRPLAANEVEKPAVGDEDDGQQTTSVDDRLLVLDMQSRTLSAGALRIIDGWTTLAADRSVEIDVYSAKDLQRLVDLSVTRQATTCVSDACLVEVAGAIGARYVLFGQAERIGSAIHLQMDLFDAEQGRPIRREAYRADDLDALGENIEAYVAEVLSPLGTRPASVEEAHPARTLVMSIAGASAVAAIGGFVTSGALISGGVTMAAWQERPADLNESVPIVTQTGVAGAGVSLLFAVVGAVALGVGLAL